MVGITIVFEVVFHGALFWVAASLDSTLIFVPLCASLTFSSIGVYFGISGFKTDRSEKCYDIVALVLYPAFIVTLYFGASLS